MRSITKRLKPSRQLLSVVFLLWATVLLLAVVNIITLPRAHAASPGDVIINEIMYNPNSGNSNDEYLELYNTTGAPIDLGGWSFTDGITLTFSGGTIIGANGYLVISPSIPQTLTTYGIVSSASYAGTNLSNGGETVTLVDGGLTVIDTVTYDDVTPWPTSPDGSGPSLELRATNLDNSVATNWGASLASGGTPLAQNSLVGLVLPSITNVTDPNGVLAAQSVVITATITGSPTLVQLKYKLNFASDVTLAMYDDGAHGDGGAGDNVYSATIPGQAIKTLVRFRVEATNASGLSSGPSSDDSIDYYGYYIKDPGVSSNAQILEWFFSDADYNNMHTNYVGTEVRFNCVVVYGDNVYDNTQVRFKGNNIGGAPKKSYKFYLPSGYSIQMNGADRAISEFHMNADYRSADLAKVPAIWWALEQTGFPVPDVITTRLERNGNFEGLYTFIDKYEKEWRADNGFNNGYMFEAISEIIYGAVDTSAVTSWKSNMTLDILDATKRDYLLDKNDIPSLMNIMTFFALTHGTDHIDFRNTYQSYNSATDRWTILPWDFDLSLLVEGPKTYISPYDAAYYQVGGKWFMTALYDQPDMRQMYFRRLRTMTDKLYTSDALKNKFEELSTLYSADNALDNAIWLDGYQVSKAETLSFIDRKKTYLLSYLRQAWAVPEAQTLSEQQSVSFDEVVADANNANEYIKLSNSSSAAVDLSNWVVEGINYTIPAGSVIPGNGSLYLLRDDLGYKAGHNAVLVAGHYGTDLGASGNLTLKTDTNVVIDSYAY